MDLFNKGRKWRLECDAYLLKRIDLERLLNKYSSRHGTSGPTRVKKCQQTFNLKSHIQNENVFWAGASFEEPVPKVSVNSVANSWKLSVMIENL
jgi:hypothetical protein